MRVHELAAQIIAAGFSQAEENPPQQFQPRRITAATTRRGSSKIVSTAVAVITEVVEGILSHSHLCLVPMATLSGAK